MRVDTGDRRRIALASLVTLVALPLVVNASRQREREPTVAVVAPDRGLSAQLQPAGSPAVGGVAPSTPVAADGVAPAPTAAPAPEGDAIWDRWPVGSAPVGSPCATPLAGLGVQLTITNLDTGRRAVCTVVEQAPLPTGVVVKLDAPVFQGLADLGESPIPVRLTA